MKRINWSEVGAVIVIAILLFFMYTHNFARAHDHPAQDAPIHEKFYRGWMMPDAPHISCCNERDCYPAEARKTDIGWEAKRREDGQWLRIPESKIERNRDNPDGRNHLCAPPPSFGDKVYCFTIGLAT